MTLSWLPSLLSWSQKYPPLYFGLWRRIFPSPHARPKTSMGLLWSFIIIQQVGPTALMPVNELGMAQAHRGLGLNIYHGFICLHGIKFIKIRCKIIFNKGIIFFSFFFWRVSSILILRKDVQVITGKDHPQAGPTLRKKDVKMWPEQAIAKIKPTSQAEGYDY